MNLTALQLAPGEVIHPKSGRLLVRAETGAAIEDMRLLNLAVETLADTLPRVDAITSLATWAVFIDAAAKDGRELADAGIPAALRRLSR